ncbi:MAG: hypothetical protein Q9169_004175 [Polycauliona sp. 2 TL-2023]
MAQKGTLFEVFLPGGDHSRQVYIKTTSTDFPNDTCDADLVPWPHYWVLDMVVAPSEFGVLNKDGAIASDSLKLESSSQASSLFLNECMIEIMKTRKPTLIRFVFSCVPGYLVRNNFLSQRLECCAGVERVETFVAPRKDIPHVPFQHVDPGQLSEVLSSAIGGLRAQCIEVGDWEAESLRLDGEFRNRFSYPWLLVEPIPHRRIAWVQGREHIDVSRRAYEAARALGISIVMLENPGHWLEPDHGPYAHLREAFIPVSIEVDGCFTQRIVDAVRAYKYPIDGLMTISDLRLPGVARACEILGLPTSPCTAYQIAGDKAKTRALEEDAGESLTLSSAAELSSLLENEKSQQLRFPLVVKPALGWNSDCVSKVSNPQELVEAVRRASARHADAASPSAGVVIEPYVEGPEVDANMVLLDGEVVYFDIADDFPTKGDAAGAGMDANFQETQVVLPSALPPDEIQHLCESLRKSILRQGFTSGVFHCEARVRHSSMHYTAHNGILDLEKRKKKEGQTGKRSVYLHEINARPPGYLESVAVMLTHGVDYYALRILLSLGARERHRIDALSRPFRQGPQFHLCILIIPQTRAGVMVTEDAGADLLRCHPELRQHVPDYDTYLKRGDILEGPSARSLWWIANFSVVSRNDRLECLRRARFIQESFTYELQ